MSDYISRADAIETVCRTRCGDKAKGCPAHSCLVIEEFEGIPSAEPIERISDNTIVVKYADYEDIGRIILTNGDIFCKIFYEDARQNDDSDYDSLIPDEYKTEPSDLIRRADVLKYPIRLDHYDEENGSREFVYGVESVIEYVESLPSANAVHGYTEWLENIIVKAETLEWLCEDTPCKEWCDENCHYSSIQAECLRHLYEVSKGGDTE